MVPEFEMANIDLLHELGGIVHKSVWILALANCL